MKFVILKYDDIQMSFISLNEIKFINVIECREEDGEDEDKSRITINTYDKELQIYAKGCCYFKIMQFLSNENERVCILNLTDFT